jgi:hypothetical protein
MTSLRGWLDADEARTLWGTCVDAGVSWQTACRAAKGAKLGLAPALRLAGATGWAVSIATLTDDGQVLEQYVQHRIERELQPARCVDAAAAKRKKRRRSAAA